MDIILRTGFSDITHDIKFKDNTVKNGKKLAFRHLCAIEEKVIDGERMIIADCVRTTSQSKEDYKVKLKVNNSSFIIIQNV